MRWCIIIIKTTKAETMWVQILVPFLTSEMNLAKFLNLCVLQFAHLKMGLRVLCLV